jgi:hypothetical protein
MNASTVDYFVGMATGLDSKKELDAGHMLGYYGSEWVVVPFVYAAD